MFREKTVKECARRVYAQLVKDGKQEDYAKFYQDLWDCFPAVTNKGARSLWFMVKEEQNV